MKNQAESIISVLDEKETSDQKIAAEIAKTYARRIWDDKDLSAIDEFIHPKCVIHSLLGDFHGPDFMKKVVQAWLIGFPDLTVKNTSILCEEDMVVIYWQAQGSHQGDFKGIKPTGKQVFYTGVTIYRLKQSKITEYWVYLNMQQLINQIK
jgi:predicted ester cyclase